MQLEQLLSSTTSESIAESLHTVMIGVEDNTGAVATDGGAPGSAERDGRAETCCTKVTQGRRYNPLARVWATSASMKCERALFPFSTVVPARVTLVQSLQRTLR